MVVLTSRASSLCVVPAALGLLAQGLAVVEELAHRMGLARRDHEVLGGLVLQHAPHRVDVVARVTPVSFRVDVAEVELLLEAVLDAAEGSDRRPLLTYLVKAVPEMTRETLMEFGKMAGLDPEVVPNSLAWKWLKEGREEGREEGRDEGAQRMFLGLVRVRFAEVPSWVEERVKAASIRELDALSERLLSATSLEELFPQTKAYP